VFGADGVDGQLVKLVDPLVVVGEYAALVVRMPNQWAPGNAVELVPLHVVNLHHPLEHTIQRDNSPDEDICTASVSSRCQLLFFAWRGSCGMTLASTPAAC